MPPKLQPIRRSARFTATSDNHSDNIMSSDNNNSGANSQDSSVTPKEFTIVQHTPAITKFCGYVNGVLLQDVESFIKSVDFFLETKKITDPAKQLSEATGYLDLTKGDLPYFLKSESFRSAKRSDNYILWETRLTLSFVFVKS